MNSDMIRLVAAVVAGCNPDTAKSILAGVNAETREKISQQIQVFSDCVDVRAWRKIINRKIVDDLYRQLGAGESSVVDFASYEQTPASEFDGMNLGAKSVQSLERILEVASVTKGAA